MSSLATVNKECRICRSSHLQNVIDFGDLALTGIFIENGADVPTAPLSLMQCNSCKLVQLGHSYDQKTLYGESYGYESHLNSSMVRHLKQKARVLESKYLKEINKPIVLDIASNDGTLLSGFTIPKIVKVGIDPIIEIVQDYYPEDAIRIPKFYSSEEYFKVIPKQANLVTSCSVIYDLEQPIEFARDIYRILEDNGIWHFEQSYLPLMIETNSYDTVCHEHLLYLSLHDIVKILESANFQIIDVSINGINGGSIAVSAIKSKKVVNPSPYVEYLLNLERLSGIKDGSRIKTFAKESSLHADQLASLLSDYRKKGFKIIGLGASTKGNVLLQWGEINRGLIDAIGDINPRKFGMQTPGTCIPIYSEESLLANPSKDTIALVLPWHFRENLLPRLEKFLSDGGNLLFPLPRIEMVSS